MMRILLIVFGALSLALGACDSDDGNNTPASQFDSEIKPILQKYCVPCHESGAGQQSVAFLSDSSELAKDAANTASCPSMTVFECIPTRVSAKEMPLGAGCAPGEAGCPTTDEFNTIKAWADAGGN